MLSVSWSPFGDEIAVGRQSESVVILDDDSGRVRQTLEGFDGMVCAVAFSRDGRALAAVDEAGSLRLWAAQDWSAVSMRELEDPKVSRSWAGFAFHPTDPVVATVEVGEVRVWDLDWDALFRGSTAERTVRSTSAKIVLVGESNVGKSCLAMRLVEDRYPEDHEHGTTHGMRFWPVAADRLHPGAAPPAGHRWEVVLWDFGGQHDYRLVHQLFLNDTTLALVLFDPTRGAAALDEIRDWNTRLDQQVIDARAVKLLVGAKQDTKSPLVDYAAIEAIKDECGFHSYVEVSARTGRNVDDLRMAIVHALDWDALTTASRPELFQLVRDHIDARRRLGDVVLLVEDVMEAVHDARSDLYDEAAVAAVTRQLAVQGVITQTTLTEGADALVLRVEVIERYAGSLIVAARQNPRGVPALEERLLGSTELPLPGIGTTERLRRLDERVVLECVAELMIQHGLCFRHEGLLIFPSLFPRKVGDDAPMPHSASLYYDFTGAIDNIYASLVARLMLSEEFGNGRLYPSRVEFDNPKRGICGIRQTSRKGGFAHLDLYFSANTPSPQRELFGRFVADHLRTQGVIIREHQAIRCSGCWREISEEIVQANIAQSQDDVICPWCRALTLISEGLDKTRGEDHESQRRIYALRMEVDRRTRADSERAKAAVAGVGAHQLEEGEPFRLLHLSDLHFTARTSPEAKVEWLLQDLCKSSDLGIAGVEYLVISGDVTQKGSEEGFERARQFVTLLNDALGVSAERCIFVPGNHDVQDVDDAYDWYASPGKARDVQPDESTWHLEGRVVFIPNSARYPRRLRAFSDAFFHKVLQQPYPLNFAAQGIAYLFPDTGVQFLTLNSSWEIDQFHRRRATVHPEALAHVVRTADRQVQHAIERGHLASGAKPLRIGVWHHALQHSKMIRDIDFAATLQQAGVQLALHGDIHEMNRERFRYWHPKALHVIGAGSFGAPANARPESTPRLYNLLEIAPGLDAVRIHTRRQVKPDGPWEGWNEWPMPDHQPGGRPFYDVDLAVGG